MRRLLAGGVLLAWVLASSTATPAPVAATFDHTYADYSALVAEHLVGTRVRYARLASSRAALDRVAATFGHVTRAEEAAWPAPQRIAYWINAYNLFTLKAVVDHYPIRGSWLSFYPKNSIRQIDGVWTTLRWRAGGRLVTLDEIEHRILRPEFQDPRIHFAVNCASLGCPALAREPFRGDQLEAQLDAAAVRYLAGSTGLVVSGTTLRLSSIFKWYGSDFEARFMARGPAGRRSTERALLGMVAQYGPAAAQSLARNAGTRIAWLDYDWTLNDVAPAP
jgi:Protein of unknown function, DUF547